MVQIQYKVLKSSLLRQILVHIFLSFYSLPTIRTETLVYTRCFGILMFILTNNCDTNLMLKYLHNRSLFRYYKSRIRNFVYVYISLIKAINKWNVQQIFSTNLFVIFLKTESDEAFIDIFLQLLIKRFRLELIVC